MCNSNRIVLDFSFVANLSSFNSGTYSSFVAPAQGPFLIIAFTDMVGFASQQHPPAQPFP